MSDDAVIVYLTLDHENIRVGKLWFYNRHGRESASFEYDANWLMHPERFALEPLLELNSGVFHTGAGMHSFGAIDDSAPDRWGRVLMRRAEIANAKKEKRIPRTLTEKDYLLNVNDEARQGALRFALTTKDHEFLSPPGKKAIPPLIQLPKLLSATERVLSNQESSEDLKLLLAPGSSLGGARPKASIRDHDGSLAIAKFPRKEDDFNVVLWEAVAMILAKNAGIHTPTWRLEHILNKPTLIVKRFDRIHSQRVPFLSAMSMLTAQDNEQHSYLELAFTIMQHGSSPHEDLEELWRRIVFTIMISNTDDHLRNHGFIYERYKGWRLSPVYDLNPTPLEVKPHVLTTAIDFDDTTASLDTALAVAKQFRLSTETAGKIITDVKTAVNSWQKVASRVGITKQECDRMASAFELCS